jgi:hypothetical protein
MGERLRVAIDFDGVIHHYRENARGGGQTAIDDTPTPGAIEWLEGLLHANVDVWLYTSRLAKEGMHCSHLRARSLVTLAMAGWLSKHGLSADALHRLEFTGEKVPADVYVDDRGFRFEGLFPTVSTLRALGARTWQD